VLLSSHGEESTKIAIFEKIFEKLQQLILSLGIHVIHRGKSGQQRVPHCWKTEACEGLGTRKKRTASFRGKGEKVG